MKNTVRDRRFANALGRAAGMPSGSLVEALAALASLRASGVAMAIDDVFEPQGDDWFDAVRIVLKTCRMPVAEADAVLRDAFDGLAPGDVVDPPGLVDCRARATPRLVEFAPGAGLPDAGYAEINGNLVFMAGYFAAGARLETRAVDLRRFAASGDDVPLDAGSGLATYSDAQRESLATVAMPAGADAAWSGLWRGATPGRLLDKGFSGWGLAGLFSAYGYPINGRLSGAMEGKDTVTVERMVAFRAFLKRLPKDVVAALQNVPNALHYFVASHACEFVDLLLRSGRADWLFQAFVAAPGFASLAFAAARPGKDMFRGEAEFTRDVERALHQVGNGRSVNHAMADLCAASHGAPVAPWVASSMATGYWSTDHGDMYRWQHAFHEATAVLQAAIGGRARHRPLRPNEVRSLVEGVYRVEDSFVGGLPDVHLYGPRRFWTRDWSPLVAPSLAERGGPYLPLANGVQDFLIWVIATVRESGPRGIATAHAFYAIAFPRGRTRPGLLAASEKWHGEADRLAAERESERLDAVEAHLSGVDRSRLFPLATGFPVPDSMAVRQLTSAQAVLDEGREMSHCVGSYRERVACGKVVVMSIEDGDGRSTVSFLVSPRGTLRVGQVAMRGNQAAPPGHVRFAAEVAEWSERSGFADDFGPRARDAGDCQRECERIIEANRPDLDGRLADGAFERLRPYLPRRWRRMSRSQWLAEVGALASMPGPVFGKAA